MRRCMGGFTLLELMITVAIVGILASLAAPLYTNHVSKARFSEAIAAVSPVKSAVYFCLLSRETASSCDEWDELGMAKPSSPMIEDIRLSSPASNVVSVQVEGEANLLRSAIYEIDGSFDRVTSALVWSFDAAASSCDDSPTLYC